MFHDRHVDKALLRVYIPNCLPNFISDVLRRGNFHPNVVAAAMFLLQKLHKTGAEPISDKATDKAKDNFLAALVVANKFLVDEACNNAMVADMGGAPYTARRISELERGLLKRLDYNVAFSAEELEYSEHQVNASFGHTHVSVFRAGRVESIHMACAISAAQGHQCYTLPNGSLQPYNAGQVATGAATPWYAGNTLFRPIPYAHHYGDLLFVLRAPRMSFSTQECDCEFCQM
ncbi:hypothetical protein EVJ58_g1569 [Rhodofomes roseus]|uniref:Uncharacterized protein n=1 Tax=Rhodofomes roseus TaxID=34475 RepID=A0A4Y9Z0K7_9APHY|nr:hypothetical protein EVJ58_g1569 [Rhodofomes roseus]